MPTTALIAAGVGAAGSIGAAAIGANAQTQNAKAAVAEQNSMLQQGYGYANNQLTNAQGVLNPWITAGSNALTQYNAALPQLTAPFSAASLSIDSRLPVHARPGAEVHAEQLRRRGPRIERGS